MVATFARLLNIFLKIRPEHYIHVQPVVPQNELVFKFKLMQLKG